MTSKRVKVEIWSDIVCPFCYIGKKKLEQAIKKNGAEDIVEIIWHSFQLDPEFPKNEVIASDDYLIKRKSFSKEQLIGIQNHLIEQGKTYDIDFNFNKALSYNTYNTHRLLQWSKSFGKSNELKRAFLEAYFTKGLNLTNQDTILSIVEEVGLDKLQGEKILNSNEFSDGVELDMYQARQLGIQGVPFFLINDKATISGAQDDRVFEQIIAAALNSSGFVMNKS